MNNSSNRIDKKTRKRKILSCFTCRSLRQKCDRKRPFCTRCVSKGCTDCTYMSSEMDKSDYAEHLAKHGLSDARLQANSDLNTSLMKSNPLNAEEDPTFKKKIVASSFTPKKVSFILPERISQKKFINSNNQYLAQRYSLTKSADAETPQRIGGLSNENINTEASMNNLLILQPTSSNLSATSFSSPMFETDSGPKKNHISTKSKSDFDNKIFENNEPIKNKLFLTYESRTNSTEATFDITTHSTICLHQVFGRVFDPTIWSIWRFMTMDFVQSIDPKVYRRMDLSILKKQTTFESRWTEFQDENLLETLLNFLPKNFDTFSSIVMCYFDTEWHEQMDIISKKLVKKKMKQIFVTDETNTIVKVQLVRFEDQYYLVMILTIFTMMVDPELYYHEIFRKINVLVATIELDNTKYTYLKCQFFLFAFTKNQMHYKSSFLKDSGIVTNFLNWAHQVDLPKFIKKKELRHSSSHADVIRMKNFYYVILYIETLLYLELGKQLNYKWKSFDETEIDVNAKSFYGVMNRFVLLTKKLIACIENPLNDVDIDFLIAKIDDFIAKELPDLPKYFDTKFHDSIKLGDYLVLNPLMSFKISLMCHKYSLVPKEEKKNYRNQLLGILFAARRMHICQQNAFLFKARVYEQENEIHGKYALTSKIDESLKNDNILSENKHRPQWLYKYLIPVYGLAAEDELSFKATSITEAIALDMLSEDLLDGVFVTQTSMDLEQLEVLAANFINKGFFQNHDIQIREYNYYDILILDKIWIEKVDQFYKLLPPRVSFPTNYGLTLVLKLLLTIDVCKENKEEIKSFDDFFSKFEVITIKRQGESGASTGMSSALATDYNTTDYESSGRRSRASSSNSIKPSFEKQPINPIILNNKVNNTINSIKEEDEEDVLNSEIVLGSLPDTPGFNFNSWNEGVFFQTNPSTPRFTDMDMDDMGMDDLDLNSGLKLFN